MKITITGEHEGKTTVIAVYTYEEELDPDRNHIDVEDEMMGAIRIQMNHYIRNYVK